MHDKRVKTHKLVLIGDPVVGKTSLRKRYLGEGFKANYSMTIGADFGVKRIVNDTGSYLFQIWDLSGQLSFQAVRKLYYNNITSLLIVFDLTNQESLDHIKSWFDEYRQNGFDMSISCILVGNKDDLLNERSNELTSKIEESKLYISNILGRDVPLFITSALSGLNVDLAFSWIIEQILEKTS